MDRDLLSVYMLCILITFGPISKLSCFKTEFYYFWRPSSPLPLPPQEENMAEL
jgi:hypothetical protein